MTVTTELSRPIAVAQIRAEGLAVVVRATSEECAAVAVRMGLPAIQSLQCRFELSVEDDGVSILAAGALHAEVTQVCVASAEEFQSPVAEQFVIRFVPAGTEQVEPDPEAPDEIPYTGNTIDLGEAATEQLGLALDPYPRMAGANVPVIDDDAEVSPFAALARKLPSDQTRH